MKKILGYFFVAILGGATFALLNGVFGDKNQQFIATSGEQLPVMQTGYISHPAVIGPDFVDAADQTVHAVVHISAELQQRNKVYNDFFDLFNDFFNAPQYRYNAPVIATGSGVIISPDGYIVTNNHVVQEATNLEITLNDRRSFKAKVIGRDPTTDLALVKIEAENLPYLVYGNSDNIKVGEWVLAVGNPFNLTSTVTAGIISAKARNINILGEVAAIESFIQTDAVVNRGNSGGALVNTEGELVGINAAIASNTGSYTGYSFAIPVNIVKKVIEDIRNYGEIQRAYLGISFQEIDSKFAEEKGFSEVKGIYVQEVLDDGAAADAGIKQGDVIVSVNNVQINSKAALLETIGTHRPGDKLMVMVMRENKLKEYTVTLKNRSGNTDVVKKDNITKLGASFESLSSEELKSLNISHGVKVTTLANGKLSSAGIRQGFIIMFVDKEPVKSVEELNDYLSKKQGGTLFEGVYPNGQRAYYGVGL
jgi:Do/DeqQ family serine protease